MKKKLTTLMLVLMMCLLLPVAVHAEETTDDQITKTVDLTNYYYYNGYYNCYDQSVYATSETSPIITTSSSNIKLVKDNWASWYDFHVYYLQIKKAGTYTITINADGNITTYKIIAMNYRFKRNSKTFVDSSKIWVKNFSTIIMYPGEKTTLYTTGASGKVTWKSSNPKVVTVTQAGKITAKANGKAKIYATCGGVSIYYLVEVSYKTSVKAIRYAQKHYNSKYSQAKRMKSGYYDCSSYVWRSYQSAGKKLMGSCPTAANMAKWCVKQKTMRFKGNVPVSKLKPGDLIFECGAKNGRYQGIYHVDLYQGNGMSITVARYKYYGTSSTLYNVMVARPCGGKCKMVTYK